MKKYTHLSREERTLIAHYHDNEQSAKSISSLVGRPLSTITRELARNSNKSGYNAETVQN